MKRKLLGPIFGLLALLLLSERAALALDRVRIGLISVSALHGALWVAEEKGLFKKYGIEPEFVIIGGSTAGISALLAGDVVFLQNSGDGIINADLRGADLVMIAAMLNKGVQRVMSRPDIKTPEDLKGKKVGITRFGTVSQTILETALAMWKFNRSDVAVVQVGSSPAMLASLDKGGIDAAVLTIPSSFVAMDRGYRVLADFADMGIYYLHSMLSVRRSFLEANRDLATRFIKGFVEGIAYFLRNKKESLAVLKKKLRTGPEAEKHLEAAYDLLAGKQYERAPYPSLLGVKTNLDFLAKENPKAKEANPNSFIDGSIIKELDESGFIKKLYE